MKKLILLRGLPGSGKTTLAEFLKHEIDDCIAIAADDYFLNSEGEYIFKLEDLHKAHTRCKAIVLGNMSISTGTIIVHNTNTTEKEMKEYFELAKEHGYEVTSLIVENRHGSSSIHDVPKETLIKMKERFHVSL